MFSHQFFSFDYSWYSALPKPNINVKIDGNKITDVRHVVVAADEFMVQKGKKTFLKVKKK